MLLAPSQMPATNSPDFAIGAAALTFAVPQVSAELM